MAVAVAIAIAALASYIAVRHQLRAELDRSLSGQLYQTRFRFNRIEVPAGATPAYFQAIQQDGTVIPQEPPSPVSLPIGPSERAVASGKRSESRRDVRIDGELYREITIQLPQGLGALQGARPLTEVERSLHRLVIVLFFVGVVGIAVAAILGQLVARAVLGPVTKLTQAAEHVAATEDLGPPIDVHGTDELARLATAFNAMLAALDGSRRQQRQLVADASHELRTPLTSVRTNLEVLARPDLPETERAGLLNDVTAQIEELGVLVADLVDLAAEGKGEVEEHNEIRLDAVCERALARAQRRAPGLTFAARIEPWVVNGHASMLERAIVNVLDNARKFAPPGSTVEITLEEGALCVRDRGPGIAEADLPHVFDRFYRATTARSQPGSGLGLAIVRQVVESHGGTVEASNPPGGGAQVCLRLPGSPPSQEALSFASGPV
jgi:two-component system sensor histidine kinase MprB